MKSEHWQQVDRLFQAALELEPVERAAFLDQNCSGDQSLRNEVEGLLNYDQQGLSVIDAPVFDMVANLLGTYVPELSTGQHVGHYNILSLLGSGGMGEVYLAQDTTLGRKIALKLLPADFTIDQERVRRFQMEARAASALNHPNIITIYEIGQLDNRHFIATEFIEGRTLRQLARDKKLTFNQVLEIGTQVAAALGAAHRAGIIHRDIKPENIMLRPDGYVKVLDFGLAKLTEHDSSADSAARTLEQLDTVPGMVLGTAKYMSPEQARGLSVDGRSDIFSLGVVLYEIVAGRAPFEGETNSDLIASILKVDPPPLTEYSPDAPVELQRIVSKALSKDKETRYKNVDDVLSDLKSLKQELELESKIQRAVWLGSDSASTSTANASRISLDTDGDLAISTGSAKAANTLSNARFLFREINRNRTRAAVVSLIILSTSVAIGYGVYRIVSSEGRAYFQNTNFARITTTGIASQAALSPDGKYLAFTEYDGKKQNLWIRQVATASNTQVASGVHIESRLTYSPDGNYLYYLFNGTEEPKTSLYSMPAFGGIPQKLISGVDSIVSISPDGNRLAFKRDYTPTESAVIVANSDGTGEKRLATRVSPSFFIGITWSPDGEKLSCVGRSRDEAGDYYELVDISMDGVEQKIITDRRWGWIGDAYWLPDGRGLVMTGAANRGGPIHVWQVSFPDGKSRRITSGLNSYLGLSITKDSSAIVTTQIDNITNLYIQEAFNSASVKQITTGSARNDGWCGLAWTPGGKIVYSSDASGRSDIWMMDPDGSNQQQLTEGLGSSVRGLSVSPDGRYIVFVSSRESGSSHVWRVDIDGSNAKRLTFGSPRFNPFFSPDGKSVFCLDGEDIPQASRVPTDGGELEPLQRPLSAIVPRGFSPDGKFFAYKPADLKLNMRKLEIARSEDGQLVKILNLPRNIQWTPDGKAITYIDNPNRLSNLWLQAIDDTPAIKLTDFKEYRITAFAWSRDGKYIVFSRGFEASDIVLITDAK